VLGSIDCGRAATRKGRRPEEFVCWAAEGEGREEDAADELGFFASGSGAHVSIGR